jgi:hypothetical protein
MACSVIPAIDLYAATKKAPSGAFFTCKSKNLNMLAARGLLDAFSVFACTGINLNLVALGDENWHADFKAGSQFGWLQDLA